MLDVFVMIYFSILYYMYVSKTLSWHRKILLWHMDKALLSSYCPSALWWEQNTLVGREGVLLLGFTVTVNGVNVIIQNVSTIFIKVRTLRHVCALMPDFHLQSFVCISSLVIISYIKLYWEWRAFWWCKSNRSDIKIFGQPALRQMIWHTPVVSDCDINIGWIS